MEKNSKKKLKGTVLWLSANIFGFELLQSVLKKYAVDISIITLTSHAKTKMYDSIHISQWHSLKIPVYEIEHINEEVNLIKSLKPDLLIVAGWRQFIDPVILNIPTKSSIGFHPTLLPYGRGPAPLINTILAGIKKSGLTLFYLDIKLDNGDIIGQKSFSINTSDYALDVYKKIVHAGKLLINTFLPRLLKGSAPRIKQDESKATYFPKRSLKDNEIDLQLDSHELIDRKIRAFSKPYKGAFIRHNDKKIIIWKGEII